jgi:DNA-binding transcriptional MerR regulator
VNRPNRIHEFARHTGVTIKTLHHYDRLGLLTPRRTDAGYRVYSPADRERLSHIVALKSLGLPLQRIKALLDQKAPLSEALERQRRVLEDKRRRLDRALRVISDVEQTVRDAPSSIAFALNALVETIELHERRDEMTRDFEHAANPRRAPDRVCESRLALFRVLEAASVEEPLSDRARELVVRWQSMLDEEIGGDGADRAALERFFASRQRWPTALRTYVASLYMTKWETWERVVDFIEQTRTAAELAD